MVKCKKCGKTYDDKTIDCFVSAGIPLDGLVCERCQKATLVRTLNTKNKEIIDVL